MMAMIVIEIVTITVGHADDEHLHCTHSHRKVCICMVVRRVIVTLLAVAGSLPTSSHNVGTVVGPWPCRRVAA